MKKLVFLIVALCLPCRETKRDVGAGSVWVDGIG